VRDAAARALGMLGSDRATGPLVRALGDDDPRVVESAATALSLLETPEAIDPLVTRLEQAVVDDLRVADTIARALNRITGKAFGPFPDAWRRWWDTVKDRPFVKPAQDDDPSGHTVAGPRYYGFPVRSSKVVFVIDVSRSMGWNERLDTAKEGLPETTRFNIVTYSDTAVAWRTELTKATRGKVKSALSFVDRLQPVNGTNTYDALRLALRSAEVDTIFFLSDGTPSVGDEIDPERILAEVRRWNRYRRVRIHTLALVRGDPPPMFAATEDPTRATSFMRRLAEENEGLHRAIQ
jgi:von Willebrand factor type A domain/HEAT repeats